jgi:hypothetical protein
MAEGGVARAVNYWVQSLAIIFAGLWGAYTFVYLEITRPASAPINLSAQVEVREAGARPVADGSALLAIELEITASNPSSRTVYLLPNYWRATGMRVGERPEAADWVAFGNQQVAARAPNLVGHHYAVNAANMVAFGSVMPDTSLKPGETVSLTYVFYVRDGEYDMIDVETVVPTASGEGSVDITWTVTPDGNVAPTVFRLEGGQRRQLSDDEVTQANSDPDLSLQSAISRRQLSLWRPRSQ